jgi:formylglycine-generating enzyme required for sulfatase activity
MDVAAVSENLTLHRYKRTNKGYIENLGDGVSLTMMLIPAGEFMMGAPENEPESRDNERPQHLVKVSQFFMGRYPVTQAQWRVVAGYAPVDIDLKPTPSMFEGDNLPVEQVSWEEATEFCKRLSTQIGKNYHLPSEAQWEYACRAKTATTYHYGDKLTTELANCLKEVGQTTAIGAYPANQWGLHDMHGNVWEWCQDDWHGSYEGAPTDGRAWLGVNAEPTRVIRGGSWTYPLGGCRSAFRLGIRASYKGSNHIGFRIACSLAG